MNAPKPARPARRLGRTRSSPAGPVRHKSPSPVAADGLDACRLALRVSHALHVAGPEPVARKQLLLAGLCEAVRAERGVLAVTRTDLRTGRQELVSAVAGHLHADGAEQHPAPPGRAGVNGTRAGSNGNGHEGGHKNGGWPSTAGRFVGDAVPQRPGGTVVLPPAAGPAGPCLDAFLPLDGLRLVACLMLARPAGGERFTPADRALVDLFHEQFRWVYAHDQRLAAADAWALPVDERRVLQDLLAGHDEATIARRYDLTPAAAARRVAAVLERLGTRSRAELLARWAL